jgi:hypothetical protein
MPVQSWDTATAELLEEAAKTHPDDLRQSMLGVAAQFRESARDRLAAESAAGEVRALAQMGDVRELDKATVSAVVSRLEGDLKRVAEAAHRGEYAMGVFDVGHALALLNAWHEEQARWEPLLEFLGDAQVAGHDKVGALGVLTALADRLPEDVRRRLGEIALFLTKAPAALEDIGWGPADLRGRAAELAVRLQASTEAATAAQFSDLLCSPNAIQRQAATRLAYQIGGPEAIGALAVLAHDTSTLVRASAAAGLVRLLGEPDPSGFHEQALKHCADDPGIRVGLALVSAFGDRVATTRVEVEVLSQLLANPSVTVRSKAVEILVRRPMSGLAPSPSRQDRGR